MARLPQRDASASAGQEPASLHPLEPPVQVVQGAVRPSRCAGPATVRLLAMGEEPEDLRAVLQGAAGATRRCAPVPRTARRCAAPRSSCRCSSRTSAVPASSHGSMSALEFTRLMDRFYRASSEVLVEHDAIIEKFVGDEVVGLFLPFLAGPDHAARAVEAARALFEAAGVRIGRGPVGAAGRRRAHGIGVRRDRREPGRARLHRARRSDEHRGASRLAGRGRRDPRHAVGRRPHPRWSEPTSSIGTCR